MHHRYSEPGVLVTRADQPHALSRLSLLTSFILALNVKAT
jgi:hypothetical protein